MLSLYRILTSCFPCPIHLAPSAAQRAAAIFLQPLPKSFVALLSSGELPLLCCRQTVLHASPPSTRLSLFHQPVSAHYSRNPHASHYTPRTGVKALHSGKP
ncbi:unnamed protein product, partial [Closterium sp. Naga37s-1]